MPLDKERQSIPSTFIPNSIQKKKKKKKEKKEKCHSSSPSTPPLHPPTSSSSSSSTCSTSGPTTFSKWTPPHQEKHHHQDVSLDAITGTFLCAFLSCIAFLSLSSFVHVGVWDCGDVSFVLYVCSVEQRHPPTIF